MRKGISFHEFISAGLFSESGMNRIGGKKIRIMELANTSSGKLLIARTNMHVVPSNVGHMELELEIVIHCLHP